jgi:Holliday junction resolvase RusA-like endonuclease
MTAHSQRSQPMPVEARTVTITIPGEPAWSLSPNARCHWAVKQRDKNEAQLALWAAIQGRKPMMFLHPVRLHWTVYLRKGGKKRDIDNLLPCLKAHLDGMVAFDILYDDSTKWIPEMPTVEQVLWSNHKGEPRIEVRIEEVA